MYLLTQSVHASKLPSVFLVYDAIHAWPWWTWEFVTLSLVGYSMVPSLYHSLCPCDFAVATLEMECVSPALSPWA